jgi:hypothetical protein
MRRLLEPEYYPLHADVYPSVQIALKVPPNGDSVGAASQCSSDDCRGAVGVASAEATTFVADVYSHYFEELWLSEKDFKQEGTLETDSMGRALRCFREVSNAESHLNTANVSKQLVIQQHEAEIQLKQTRKGPCFDNFKKAIENFREKVPDSGWVAFFKGRAEQGFSMEFFHSRCFQSHLIHGIPDIISVVLTLPRDPKDDCKSPSKSQSRQSGSPLTVAGENKSPVDEFLDALQTRNSRITSVDWDPSRIALLVNFFQQIRKNSRASFQQALKLLDSVIGAGSTPHGDDARSSSQNSDNVLAPSDFQSSSASSDSSASSVSSDSRHRTFEFLAKTLIQLFVSQSGGSADGSLKDDSICIYIQPIHKSLVSNIFPRTFVDKATIISGTCYVALEHYLYALAPKLQPRQDRHIHWWESHIETKQQSFDKCAEALLNSFTGGEGCSADIDGKEDYSDNSSRASTASNVIRRNLDDFKLLEAFKYLLHSDRLFCKVLVFIICFILFNLCVQPKWCAFFS